MQISCIECELAERRHDIKVTYAVGLGPCIPWSFKLFTDWYDFADWMKQQNLQAGPVVVIAWEYVPCRS